MDDLDKNARRSAFKLIAAGGTLVFWIGLGVGLAIAYHTIDRVVIITADPGVEV